MRKRLIAIGCCLAAAGCAVVPTDAPISLGTLEASVTLGGFQTQGVASDVARVRCAVVQGAQTQNQELPASSLASQAFLFQLAEGTASVAADAYKADGSFLGGSYAIVGIRSGHVTMLRTTIVLDNPDNSSFRPLLPLPIQGATVSL